MPTTEQMRVNGAKTRSDEVGGALNSLIAIFIFFLPMLPVWLLFGARAMLGGLLYMAILLMCGEVSVKFKPFWKKGSKVARLEIYK